MPGPDTQAQLSDRGVTGKSKTPRKTPSNKQSNNKTPRVPGTPERRLSPERLETLPQATSPKHQVLETPPRAPSNRGQTGSHDRAPHSPPQTDIEDRRTPKNNLKPATSNRDITGQRNIQQTPDVLSKSQSYTVQAQSLSPQTLNQTVDVIEHALYLETHHNSMMEAHREGDVGGAIGDFVTMDRSELDYLNSFIGKWAILKNENSQLADEISY
jgi:hypothetical protein